MVLARSIALASAAWLVSACSTTATHPATTTTISPVEIPANAPDTYAPAVASVGVSRAVEDDDPMVCRTQARTGTKITRRVCRRQSEIDAAERSARDSVDTFQRKAAGQTTWAPDPANP